MPSAAELTLDHHLRGDAGVIRARLPQRRVAAHAVPAGEGVHERVLEGVPHVQRAGDIRRRQHDAVEGAIAVVAAMGRESARGFPTFVDAGFDFAR